MCAALMFACACVGCVYSYESMLDDMYLSYSRFTVGSVALLQAQAKFETVKGRAVVDLYIIYV